MKSIYLLQVSLDAVVVFEKYYHCHLHHGYVFARFVTTADTLFLTFFVLVFLPFLTFIIIFRSTGTVLYRLVFSWRHEIAPFLLQIIEWTFVTHQSLWSCILCFQNRWQILFNVTCSLIYLFLLVWLPYLNLNYFLVVRLLKTVRRDTFFSLEEQLFALWLSPTPLSPGPIFEYLIFSVRRTYSGTKGWPVRIFSQWY